MQKNAHTYLTNSSATAQGPMCAEQHSPGWPARAEGYPCACDHRMRPHTPRSARASQRIGARAYAEELRRTLDPAPTPVEHMGIDHRRPDVLVTEQFLHGADVIPR